MTNKIAGSVYFLKRLDHLIGYFDGRDRKPATYRNRVLAFDEELDENLGSNNSSIFLQNSLLQEIKKTFNNLWYVKFKGFKPGCDC